METFVLPAFRALFDVTGRRREKNKSSRLYGVKKNNKEMKKKKKELFSEHAPNEQMVKVLLFFKRDHAWLASVVRERLPDWELTGEECNTHALVCGGMCVVCGCVWAYEHVCIGEHKTMGSWTVQTAFTNSHHTDNLPH